MTDLEIAEFALQVRDLLADGWTQRAYARNRFGIETAFFSPDAVEFCMMGAAFRLVPPQVGHQASPKCLLSEEFFRAFGSYLEARGYPYPIHVWNDTCWNKEQVLDTLDDFVRFLKGT